MKVLMIVRSTFLTSPGGDTVQVNSTAHWLRKLGIEVDIKLSHEQLVYSEYDALHFFNIIRPDDILPHIGKGVPFFISTIFVDYSEYEKRYRKGISGRVFRWLTSGQIEYLKAIARWIKNGDAIKSNYYLLFGHRASIKYLVKKAQMLLPNSDSEYKRLLKYTGVPTTYRKVVNAIDPSVFHRESQRQNELLTDVICVARIEGRKNQLNVIRAINNTSLRLTIIGKPSPNHLSYYNECKAAAAGNSNIRFIEHIEHDKLVRYYMAAKVHILASWFETTGLSSLEAAAMGCNIVVSDKGDVKEYFQHYAYYCEPDNTESITDAILKAFYEPSDPKLKDYVLQNYTWEKAAKETINAYKSLGLPVNSSPRS